MEAEHKATVSLCHPPPPLFSSLAQGEIPTPTWFGELLRQRRSIHEPVEANCRGLSSGDADPQG